MSRATAKASPPSEVSAVPTLRVMRLQSPELHQPFAGSLAQTNMLESALCLPDSLGVFVGERFTAYLGILNSSKSMAIRKLAVNALLQTPSQRWQLPSPLDAGSSVGGGLDVAPNSGVDAIVSHDIEEPGQHILRVEVTYISAEGNSKTFRKFYRFHVVSPLMIQTTTVRSGDATCFVSVHVEWNAADQQAQGTEQEQPLLISQVDIHPEPGLTATCIGTTNATDHDDGTAVDMFDHLSLLMPSKGSFRYLFKIEATSQDAILRGMAAGDVLGKAVVTWSKAMGETGRIVSPPIVVTAVQPEIPLPGMRTTSNFVVYNSGLSVDVAASMANSAKGGSDLSRKLPVTVEPIDPPARMQLHVPQEVQFLIVNHSQTALNLQLQFCLPQMTGLAVCGPSFQSLGNIPPNGGSTVASARFVPLAAGLLRVQGCCVQDMVSENEILQPALFQTFVEEGERRSVGAGERESGQAVLQ